MYEEQFSNDWPGLAKEAAKLCEKLNIKDVNFTDKSKTEYAKNVKEACRVYDKDY